METLCIIPSGKPKIWDKYPEIGEVAAEEAYTGTFHRLCQQYARTFYNHWVILSPKYGVLHPKDRIAETYDLNFKNISKDPNVISISVMKEQLRQRKLIQTPHVVMLGGQKFKPIMEQLFEPDTKIDYPLHGSKGIGIMQQRLKDAIHKQEMI